MKLSELNNLTLENIGTCPKPVKIAAAVVVFAIILGLGFWKDVSVQQENLATEEERERSLKVAFEGKQKKAANLEALKQQQEDIKETFGDLLKRLPNKTEVAALLVDISQQGLAAGLEFELFRPGAEKPADFYVELPIQIKVTGDYHAFGTFISGVSDLPRIVTNHDIRITPRGSAGGLVLETVAKTYRYMDEEEELAESKAARPRGRR
jgi:type IV pilus assembly protein PilO